MHTRRKIRAAVVDRLRLHQQLTQLFDARTKRAGDNALPFANVLTGNESVDDLSDQFQEKRTLQVLVKLVVSQSRGMVDELDDLAEVVEALLSADQTLGGVCNFFRYKGCDPDFDSAAEQEVAALTLTYECQYSWEPSIELPDLSQVSLGIDMAGPRNDPQLPSHPDGQTDAVATINLPQ